MNFESTFRKFVNIGNAEKCISVPPAGWAIVFRRVGMGMLILLAVLAVRVGSSGAGNQVLVINSYHPGLSWTDSIMDGIRETFSQSGLDVQLSAEYLDARRHVEPGRARMIREVIAAKLKALRPDIVIASDNAALDFVLAERDRLFRGVPVIFAGINHFEPSMISKYSGITGVAEDLSVAETVALALTFHPETREIVVIGRTSVAADKANRDAFVEAMPRLPRGIAVSFWDDLPASELADRLQSLEKGSVLFLNGLMTDKAGRQMMYGETTSWVRQHSAVPIYSFWDVYLGYGMVGGKLVSGKEQGRKAAEMALNVTSGASADRIPVVNAREVNRYMFDYRELERFDIRLSKLPQGAVVINRPDSLYQSHKGLIVAWAAVVLVLSALVMIFSVLMIRSRRAEEALRQANIVVENSSVTLFRWKAREGWPVEWVSRNVIQFGYAPEELCSGKVLYSSVIHPDDLDPVVSEVAAYTAAGLNHFVQEYRVVTKGGDVRWVQDRTAVERDASGNAAMYEGIVEDITERKEAERALKEKSEELDRFFTAALDLLCIADTDGYFRRLNPQWQVVLGYPLAELEGRRFLDFVHPDDVANTLEALGDLSSEKPVTGFVNRYRHKDGSYRWIEWRSYPADKLVYAAARDITEGKAAEEALKRSEEKYRDIFERAVEGIFQSTPGGIFLSVNPSFARMLGYDSPEELLESSVNIADQLYVQPELRTSFKRALEKTGSTVTGFEHELRRKDGAVIWVSTNARSVRDSEGTILYYEGTSENITPRKRAEEENARLEQRLLQSQKIESLGRLAGGVAHDFNNMLTVILGNIELMKQELPEDHTLTKGVREIEKAAVHSRAITRQLLAFSRKQVIEPKIIDLNESIRRTQETLVRLIGEDIDLRFNPGKGLWKVRFDLSQIDQILVNLAVNSRDAMPAGGNFTIGTENVYVDEAFCWEHPPCSPGDYVLLTVSDDGQGMDNETVSHVFEPFFTTKEEGQGTGLGLATVYGIIKQNQGFVDVKSEPGQGAEFRIYIPRQEGEVEPAGKAEESPAISVKRTILLVEDNEMVRAMVAAILRAVGHEVVVADSPHAAISLCGNPETKIDLLLTDVVMPVMSGKELSDRIKAMAPEIKVLFMSGYTADVIINLGLQEEVHFIQKPFGPADLARKINEAMGDGESRQKASD